MTDNEGEPVQCFRPCQPRAGEVRFLQMEPGQEQETGTVAAGGRPSDGTKLKKRRQPESPGTEKPIRKGYPSDHSHE